MNKEERKISVSTFERLPRCFLRSRIRNQNTRSSSSIQFVRLENCMVVRIIPKILRNTSRD